MIRDPRDIIKEICVVCGKLTIPWLWVPVFKASACEKCAASFSNDKERCRTCFGTKYVNMPYFYSSSHKFAHMISGSIDRNKLYFIREFCGVCKGTGKRPKIIWKRRKINENPPRMGKYIRKK